MERPGSHLIEIQGSCLCLPTGSRKPILAARTIDPNSEVIHNTRIRLRTWLLFLLPFCGWMTEHRWRTLSAFLKLLPVNHRMAVSPRFFTTNKTLGPLPTILEMIYKLGRRTPVLGRVSHSPTSKNGWGWKCFGTVLCYGLVFLLWMVC